MIPPEARRPGDSRAGFWRGALIFLLMALPSPALAAGQGPPAKFVKILDMWEGLAAASDSKGNTYVGGGYFTALVKLDPQGQLLWSIGAREYIYAERENYNNIRVSGIHVGPTDRIHVCGRINGAADLLGKAQPIYFGLFFGEFTHGGSNVFANVFYGDRYPALTHTQDGALALTLAGTTSAKYEGLQPSPLAYGDFHVFKVQADGSPIWVRQANGHRKIMHGASAFDTQGNQNGVRGVLI